MFLRGVVLVLGALVLALVGPASIAQASTSHAGVSAQDRTFLRAAHQSNLAEISTGKLADQKGRSAKVRELGRMFIKDHTKLDADLKKVAKNLGVSLPDQPNAEQRALAAKLRKLSGTAFDKAYLDGQLTSHVKARTNGRTELSKGSNPDVLKLAKTSAPIVQHHINELVYTRRDYGKA